jgi:hypothetical protein
MARSELASSNSCRKMAPSPRWQSARVEDFSPILHPETIPSEVILLNRTFGAPSKESGRSELCNIENCRSKSIAMPFSRRPELGSTEKRRRRIFVGISVLVVIFASITVSVAATSGSCPFGQRLSCDYVFKVVPRSLLVNGEIEFKRLSASNLSLVRITPTDARRDAEAQYGNESGSRIVLESLGGYIDKNQIIPDWVGTKSWVPKPIPSYLVRIYGDQLVTVDPSTNHYWNVVVSAVSGKIITAFTYD